MRLIDCIHPLHTHLSWDFKPMVSYVGSDVAFEFPQIEQ